MALCDKSLTDTNIYTALPKISSILAGYVNHGTESPTLHQTSPAPQEVRNELEAGTTSSENNNKEVSKEKTVSIREILFNKKETMPQSTDKEDSQSVEIASDQQISHDSQSEGIVDNQMIEIKPQENNNVYESDKLLSANYEDGGKNEDEKLLQEMDQEFKKYKERHKCFECLNGFSSYKEEIDHFHEVWVERGKKRAKRVFLCTVCGKTMGPYERFQVCAYFTVGLCH